MRFHRIFIFLALIPAILWQSCSSAPGGGNGRSTDNGGTNPVYLLYTDATASTVNIASIASNGTLTKVGTGTQTGVEPVAIATTPYGKYVYVLNASSGTVSQFAVATDGTLTQPGTPVGTALQPTAIAVDPQQRFVIVANQGAGAGPSISVFGINASTGSLTPAGTPISINVTDPQAVTISGNYIYVASASSIDVLVFNPATSSLAFEPGSPFPAGTVATDITGLYSPPQAANLLYATDVATNSLLSFALDSTGTLTPTGTLATGTQPMALVAGNQNRLLFVANQSSDDLSVFTIDAVTGVVAPAATPLVTIGAGPNTVAYDSTNNLLLVGLSGTKQITAFSVNTSTGALSAAGSPLNMTNSASGLAVAKP